MTDDIESIITRLTNMKTRLLVESSQKNNHIYDLMKGCLGEIGCEIEDAENAVSDLAESEFTALSIEAQGFLRGLTFAFQLVEETINRADIFLKGHE